MAEKKLVDKLLSEEIQTNNAFILYTLEGYRNNMHTAQQTAGKIQQINQELQQLQEFLTMTKGRLHEQYETMEFWLKKENEVDPASKENN